MTGVAPRPGDAAVVHRQHRRDRPGQGQHRGRELVEDVVEVDDVGPEPLGPAHDLAPRPRVPQVKSAAPAPVVHLAREHVDVVASLAQSIGQASDVDLGPRPRPRGEVVDQQHSHR